MKMEFEQNFKFKLDLDRKYTILNKYGRYSDYIYYKAFFRTKDIHDIFNTILPYQTNIKPTPHVNQLTDCLVNYKPQRRLIRFLPNQKTKDISCPLYAHYEDHVLSHPTHKVTFTEVKQDNMATINLRSFIIPTTKMKEAIEDIQKDLFLSKI